MNLLTNQKTNQAFKILGITLCLIFITSSVLIFSINYEDFIYWIAKRTGKLHVIDRLKFLISVKKYLIFQITPLVLAFSSLLFFLFPQKFTDLYLSLLELTYWLFGNLKNRIKFCISSNEYILLAIIILLHILFKGYFIYYLPISYDEAFTFLNFTSNGPLTSISYFPVPNNHIFHSFLTNLTYLLPFPSLINLRLPSFMASILVIVTFYFLIRDYFNNFAALVSVAVLINLFPISYYSITARGYGLVLLCFITSFHAFLKIINNENPKNNKFFFSIIYLTSVLGFYTMPSYLYPCSTLLIMLFYILTKAKDKNSIKHFVLTTVLIGISVILLYTPIFIVSGIRSVTNYSFVKPLSRYQVLSKLFEHFENTFSFIFSIEIALYLTFIFFIFSFLLSKKKHKRYIKICFFFILLTFIIPILHSLFPLYRTWIYLVVPILFILSSMLAKVKLKMKFSFILLLLIIGSLNFSFYNKIFVYEKYAFEGLDLYKYLNSQNAKRVYFNHGLAEAYVRFYYQIANKPFKVIFSKRNPNEINNYHDNSIDFFVLDSRNHQPVKSMNLVFKNEFVLVYN